MKCFNTQPPEGGCQCRRCRRWRDVVSTHSRPKAAATLSPPAPRSTVFQHTAARRRLRDVACLDVRFGQFQHTAARRRLPKTATQRSVCWPVSTHSRPKAAAHTHPAAEPARVVSTHSRPKAAAVSDMEHAPRKEVSTHSRPKAAVTMGVDTQPDRLVSTHSRPKAAATSFRIGEHIDEVSTHSRPKAAAWTGSMATKGALFQHTAARRRLRPPASAAPAWPVFQHTAARRRLLPT